MNEIDTHPDSQEGAVWCHWLVQASRSTTLQEQGVDGEWLKGVAIRASPSPAAQGLLEKIPSSLKRAAEKGGGSEDSSQAKTCSEGSTQRS